MHRLPTFGTELRPTRSLLLAAVVPVALAALADDARVRRQFHAAGRDALTDRLLRTHPDLVHVLVADADELKTVNDTLGHAAGDALIAAIGHRLGTWAAGHGGVAARLGGDDFGAVVLLHAPPPSAQSSRSEACCKSPPSTTGTPCTQRCPSARPAPPTCRTPAAAS